MIQLIFPNNKAVFHHNDFTVSESNINAYKYITCQNLWGVHPYKNILIVSGSKSSGKTHLAHIWKNINNAILFNNNKDVYKLGDYNVIYEDIHEIKNQVDFFHFINERNASNQKTLLTCNDNFLKFTLADLLSRINSINKIQIKEPDEKLITNILEKKFSDYNIKLNNKVINYILYRIPRSYDEINNVVKKIHETTMIYQKEITIPFLNQFFYNYYLDNKTD